ncbi:hypothetical protein N7509_007026 [Penicillium cosmopolitanum]|uniref:Uncharacterized protein n=1 Tax=Penicillium cosmopolitanum TaxID=1131564 RepID=A0A9X0B814_9EURO|nr:uncharacterized protein N7509_007026 [Penicillium cosmopolitanum]KAJ5391536.1 hypothetical protein N7509_007026 [Penicillium cosmopolitanum]
MIDDEEKYWLLLGIRRGSVVRDSITLTLFKVLEDTKLLAVRINQYESQEILRPAIFHRIRQMPSQVQALMLQDPEECLDALSRIAQLCKQSTYRVWKYYKDTATHMLHEEKVVFVAPDGITSKSTFLSRFLTTKRALYHDGTVDERHLSYGLFVDKLKHFCGYDPSIHDISLWHVEPGSQSRLEANAVTDHDSWISAMIEEQNMLQSSKTPVVFHVAELNTFYLGQRFES